MSAAFRAKANLPFYTFEPRRNYAQCTSWNTPRFFSPSISARLTDKKGCVDAHR